jgi:hypothetical protein
MAEEKAREIENESSDPQSARMNVFQTRSVHATSVQRTPLVKEDRATQKATRTRVSSTKKEG